MSEQQKGMRELAEQFKKMEVRHDLFNKKTSDGIYYWDIFRYSVYMTILSRYEILSHGDLFLGANRDPLWKRLAKVVRMLPNYLINEFRFIFVLPRNKKFCFLKLSRFQDEKGNPADLLFEDIYEQFRADAFVLEYFRHPSFSWFKKNIKNRYFLYPLEMSLLLRQEKSNDWSSLSDLINKEFGISVKWEKAFQNRISGYRKEYRFFSNLFRRIKPRVLFFQSDPRGMIAAANDLGILTLDLQHGHINNVGMTYSYPQNIDVGHIKSIPKVVLTLGEFWNGVIDFPNQKITCGNSYYYIEPDKDAGNRKGIMAVSGYFVHDFLEKQVADLARLHPEIMFYYKLHSGQMDQLKECKAFFEPYKNVTVIYTEKSVKEIMDDCFAIVLIQSSVAYQALQKGLKVFTFKTSYYEASYEIFNEKGVVLVNDAKELSSNINTAKEVTSDSHSIYYQPYNRDVVKNLVSHNLN
jgi:hypothetical protein